MHVREISRTFRCPKSDNTFHSVLSLSKGDVLLMSYKEETRNKYVTILQ